MIRTSFRPLHVAPIVALTAVAATTASAPSQGGLNFQSGVDLINVTATVTDS